MFLLQAALLKALLDSTPARGRGAFREQVLDRLYGEYNDVEAWGGPTVHTFDAWARAEKTHSIEDQRLNDLVDYCRTKFRSTAYSLFNTKVGALRAALGGIDVREGEIYKADPSARQIALDAKGRNRITNGDGYVDTLRAVYVDDVTFYQERDGVIAPFPGKYLRVMLKRERNGAVSLVVDASSGDVLLVTQYRHPSTEFLTEAIRGYSEPQDASEAETSQREAYEEGFVRPLDVRLPGSSVPVKAVIQTQTLMTDSAFLSEAPGYFLILVDKAAARDTAAARRGPVMENPVWVRMKDFYRAVLNPAGSRLAMQEDDRLPAFAEAFTIRTEVDEGHLRVRDSMTYIAAMAARPYLAELFPWFNAMYRKLEREMIANDLSLARNLVRQLRAERLALTPEG